MPYAEAAGHGPKKQGQGHLGPPIFFQKQEPGIMRVPFLFFLRAVIKRREFPVPFAQQALSLGYPRSRQHKIRLLNSTPVSPCALSPPPLNLYH